MRRHFVIAILVFIVSITSSVVAIGQKKGTLYSPMRYRSEPRAFCLNFKSGLNKTLAEPCDLRYGLLAINNDLDWLQISTSRDSRAVIQDLGPYSWGDRFEVPVLDPLPRLKPGQDRNVSIDVSGPDGEAGNVAISGQRSSTEDPPILARRQSREGKPKVDPAFVRAVTGHIYAVRVVDEKSDYYALFRIENLNDGTCDISWKLIPSPKE
jgi:hypothetical protein